MNWNLFGLHSNMLVLLRKSFTEKTFSPAHTNSCCLFRPIGSSHRFNLMDFLSAKISISQPLAHNYTHPAPVYNTEWCSHFHVPTLASTIRPKFFRASSSFFSNRPRPCLLCDRTRQTSPPHRASVAPTIAGVPSSQVGKSSISVQINCENSTRLLRNFNPLHSTLVPDLLSHFYIIKLPGTTEQ